MLVGKLNGENVTTQALKNLVQDRAVPLTFNLLQLENQKDSELNLAQKSESDNLSVLFDHNVTRGALKNLVTDRPSPLTVKLAQRNDADNLSVLFDHNVTRGALKNLVTDRPSPLTVKLAQNTNKNSSAEEDVSTMTLHGPAVVGGTKVVYAANGT